jgi:hypothetical protein
VNVDVSELNQLAADLTKAGLTAGVKAVAVAEQSGRELRDEARRLAPRKRLPHYAETITDEVTVEPGAVVVEVGPEARGQGKLGHILERGAPATGFPPHAHLGPALDRVTPAFVRRVADIGGDVL